MARTHEFAGDFTAFLRPERDGRRSLDLLVTGARCANCMAKIEREVAALPGVDAARLNLSSGKLTVGFGAGRGDPGAVLQRLEAIGYPAKPFDPAQAAAIRRSPVAAAWAAGISIAAARTSPAITSTGRRPIRSTGPPLRTSRPRPAAGARPLRRRWRARR